VKRLWILPFSVAIAIAVLAFTSSAARAQTSVTNAASAQLAARVAAIVAKLTTAQKLALMHGADDPRGFAGFVPGIPELGIPPLALDDGPMGVRHGPSTALPSPLGLAATWDVALAESYGEVLGRDARAKGANALLGPTLNLARTPFGGRIFEGFGEDPYLAGRIAAPEVAALQAQHVVSVIKHYVLNDQENGRARDSSEVDARTLHELYLAPFAAAIREGGAQGVMCAYNRIDGVYACENSATYDILRHELGFTGFVVSDWFAQHDIYKSIFTGLDLEMPRGIIYGPYLTAAVARGNVRQNTLDLHVGRTLGAMLSVGLFEHPPAASELPSVDDVARARAIADGSAVLLKNDGGVLPLDRRRLHSLAIVGPGADPLPAFGGGSARVEQSGNNPSPLAALRAAAPGVDIRYAYAQAVPFEDDVPSVDTLALEPAPRGGHGLSGAYYANGELSGTPALRRVDRSIAFDFNSDPPADALPYPGSIRWSGIFRVPADGMYAIGAEGRCACRLRVGAALLLDAWNRAPSDAPVPPAPIALRAGIAYPIVFDWRRGGDTFVRLIWKVPPGVATPDIARAAAVAKNADAAIVFVGDYETEGRDRTSLALLGAQNELITAVAAVNRHTVVVVDSGGAIVMSSWLARVPAVLEAWYPGEAAGTSAADLLFGDVAPSGKLPLTFPADEGAVPARPLYPPGPGEGPARSIRYAEGLAIGYRWYDANARAPQFPFGFGLSYTTFAFAHLAAPPRLEREALNVSVDVTNTGTSPGSEVAQLYVTFPPSSGEPPRILRDFVKVPLAAQETRTIHFTLARDALQTWSAQTHGWHVVPGTYMLAVGSSSRDLPLATSVDVQP